MKINGKAVPWLFGESILDAANKAGVFIPSLCCDPTFLNKDSCCRLCIVEVKMGDKVSLMPACATETEAEMEINTDSETIHRIRKMLLQLIYAEAPENPTIMELMKKCGVKPNTRISNKGGRDCVLCRRCINACHYWVKGAIESMGRGVTKRIDTPYGKPTEDCLGCASCELICPIHSIKSEDYNGKRKIWNNEFELLYCEECGTLITTKENFFDGNYDDAPILCHTCSEEYRKRHRKNEELYCY